MYIGKITCPVCKTPLVVRAGLKYEIHECPHYKLSFSLKDVETEEVIELRGFFNNLKTKVVAEFEGDDVPVSSLVKMLREDYDLSESLAYDFIDELKLDAGAYEREGVLCFG